ncbi:hypothetical protein JTB14_026997 [Gonioctena quinquepunctata]|nr:hypothetical protein JTB14_026997 [Gonioctena quinquepunctata]
MYYPETITKQKITFGRLSAIVGMPWVSDNVVRERDKGVCIVVWKGRDYGKLSERESYGSAHSAIIIEPESYEKASNSDFSVEWVVAIQDGLESLKRNNTVNRNIKGSKWISEVKSKPGNALVKLKARLVAEVVFYDSVRTLESIATMKDMEIA